MVIPINLNTPLPINIKRIATKVAVVTESIIALFLCFLFNPSAREIKTGILPMASTATNIGIKARIYNSNIFSITLNYTTFILFLQAYFINQGQAEKTG